MSSFGYGGMTLEDPVFLSKLVCLGLGGLDPIAFEIG